MEWKEWVKGGGVVYPEEIVENANLLMKDIADSKDNIDAKLAAYVVTERIPLIGVRQIK